MQARDAQAENADWPPKAPGRAETTQLLSPAIVDSGAPPALSMGLSTAAS
jgi:hypothetical protein